jgi:hypothetical protein
MDKKKVISNQKEGFAISQTNVKIIVISVVLIVVGYFLVAGGKSDDPNVFNPELFNFRRLTLAPIVMMLGFVGVVYGIMKKN